MVLRHYAVVQQWTHSQRLVNVLGLIPTYNSSYEFGMLAVKPLIAFSQ